MAWIFGRRIISDLANSEKKITTQFWKVWVEKEPQLKASHTVELKVMQLQMEQKKQMMLVLESSKQESSILVSEWL